MNYGPSAKQLEQAWKLAWKLVTSSVAECPDPDGWYEDGQRDRKRGRAADYGACSLQVNQEAYLRGYQKADV